jgi:hypothetical protein
VINLAVAVCIIRKRPVPRTGAARKRLLQQPSSSFSGGHA